MRISTGILVILLFGCTEFPEVEATGRALPPAGAPPPLLPYEQLEAMTVTGAVRAADTEDLEARAAALRTRAAILRQPADDIDALRARLAARS